MRIDKLLTQLGLASRREAAQLVQKGRLLVDGVRPKTAAQHVDPAKQTVTLDGQPLVYQPKLYLMLNKPQGVVSSTDEPGQTTVLDLVEERHRRMEPFPCGRLDKNTLGLVLLTNDGPLAHRLLSPRHHVEKEYRYRVKFPLSPEDLRAWEEGVVLENGYRTQPCRVRATGPNEGFLILTEGKYHQIKEMAKAVHNQITFLQRIRFGPLLLGDLAEGQWRELSPEEIALLQQHAQGAEC